MLHTHKWYCIHLPPTLYNIINVQPCYIHFAPCHRWHNFRTNLLMLLRKTIVIRYEKHKAHANALKVKCWVLLNLQQCIHRIGKLPLPLERLIAYVLRHKLPEKCIISIDTHVHVHGAGHLSMLQPWALLYACLWIRGGVISAGYPRFPLRVWGCSNAPEMYVLHSDGR